MVREYVFHVGLNDISPAGRQIVGMQGEVNATTIKFIVDEAVRNKMLVGTLKYRFEVIDSLGNVDFGELKDLTWETEDEIYRTFEYVISEAVAKNGGNAEVYLIIACFDENDVNSYEWRSRPARFTFVGVENSGNAMGEERDSLSALAHQALTAADYATEAAKVVEELHPNLTYLYSGNKIALRDLKDGMYILEGYFKYHSNDTVPSVQLYPGMHFAMKVRTGDKTYTTFILKFGYSSSHIRKISITDSDTEAKGYTVEDVEYPLVSDQTYNPESTNAQSGLAVAEAIKDINDAIDNMFEKMYEGLSEVV